MGREVEEGEGCRQAGAWRGWARKGWGCAGNAVGLGRHAGDGSGGAKPRVGGGTLCCVVAWLDVGCAVVTVDGAAERTQLLLVPSRSQAGWGHSVTLTKQGQCAAVLFAALRCSRAATVRLGRL